MPKPRRIMSCGTCRRLRTRCEKIGSNTCRRCQVLRLSCSFSESTPARLPDENTTEPKGEVGGVSDRLTGIESSLHQIKSLLTRSLGRNLGDIPQSDENENDFLDSSTPSINIFPMNGEPPNLGPVRFLTDGYAKTAPISIIRDMKHNILGTSPGLAQDEPEDDAISLGLITESLSNALLVGFSSVSPRLYGLLVDPSEIRQKSPLLFAASLLTGLHTIPSLYNSRLHITLYSHAEGLMGKALLASPLPLHTIQSFLIFAMWNLVPHKRDTYIDSWLMSGMAIMHSMLSFDFGQLLESSHEEQINDNTGIKIRIWTLLCLTHLQFSVGTGRPPIISEDNYNGRIRSIELFFTGSWNRANVAESRLYFLLYRLITTDKIEGANLKQKAIDSWRDENINLDDDSLSLQFAYSCASLILTRHILRQLSNAASSMEESAKTDEHQIITDKFIAMAIKQSHEVMHIFLRMLVPSQNNITPAYNFLMCTNAAITLIEFPHHLESITETLALMENLSQCIQESGREDKVFEWAVNVMRMAAIEESAANS